MENHQVQRFVRSFSAQTDLHTSYIFYIKYVAFGIKLRMNEKIDWLDVVC